MTKFLISLCVCFGIPHPMLAWNGEGHMVVAQIAYNHLESTVKTKCDALIAVPLAYGSSGNNTFVTAACWADDYKSSLGSGIWHYIDLPFSLDGTPTTGVNPAAFDVVQAINLSISTLQDTNAPQTNQATSLRYLLHFVGDIQQPLHCSTAVSASRTSGDAGGNGFSINGNWSNLHSLWDAGGGYLGDPVSRPLSDASQATLNNKVSMIEADYPYTANTGTIPNPMDWAQEGLGLAQTVAYVGITQNSTPSTNYLNTVQAAAEERVARGGRRLADLLNTIFASNPVSLASVTLSNGNCFFSWSASPNKTYRVQWKQRLDDAAWNDLTDVNASTNSASFIEPLAQMQRFYRVKPLL